MSQKNQLTLGQERRLMYVENKEGDIEGVRARIGWVTFSRTGKSVHYRGMEFFKIVGGGVRGNFKNLETREEFWISGVKKRGSNSHYTKSVSVEVDPDALEAYNAHRSV